MKEKGEKMKEKKVKGEDKTERKPPKKEEKAKARGKRKNETNIDERVKKPKKRRKQSTKLSIDQKIERERRKNENKKNKKTRTKSIKGLVDFNNFIRDEVVEPGQKQSFDLKARDVKQEIINSY